MSGTITNTQVKINAPKVVKGKEKDLEAKVQSAGLDTGIKEAVDSVTELLDAVILRNGKLKLTDKQKDEIRNNQAIKDAATQVSQNIAMAKIALQETNGDKIESTITSIVDNQTNQLLKVIQKQVTPYGITLNQKNDKRELVKSFKEKITPPSSSTTQKNKPKTIDKEAEIKEINDLMDGLEDVFNNSSETINQSYALITESEINDIEKKQGELISLLEKPNESSINPQDLVKLKSELKKASDFFNEIKNLSISEQQTKLVEFKKQDQEAAKTFQAILYNQEKLYFSSQLEQNTALIAKQLGSTNVGKIKTELKVITADLNEIKHNVSGISTRESKTNLAKLYEQYNTNLRNSSTETEIDTARNNFIKSLEASTNINTSDIKDLTKMYTESHEAIEKLENKQTESSDGKSNGAPNILSEENIQKALKVGVPAIGGTMLLAMFFPPAQKLLGMLMSSAGGLTNLGITIFREMGDQRERELRIESEERTRLAMMQQSQVPNQEAVAA